MLSAHERSRESSSAESHGERSVKSRRQSHAYQSITSRDTVLPSFSLCPLVDGLVSKALLPSTALQKHLTNLVALCDIIYVVTSLSVETLLACFFFIAVLVWHVSTDQCKGQNHHQHDECLCVVPLYWLVTTVCCAAKPDHQMANLTTIRVTRQKPHWCCTKRLRLTLWILLLATFVLVCTGTAADAGWSHRAQ